ncbi:hypothetical protein GCM10027586_03820 [Kineococcus gypseus]|uniref:hypothetical protein n=1 Tax=Kineococcus gypseus TaxID=1637102 RepID=UPI003D7EF980
MSCPSGKVRYRDRIAAELALLNAHRSSAARRNEVRVYQCEKCRGWHLTSRH